MARLIKRLKQNGFTLVELLIVVAIIGVLSTIGIPTFRRMVQKSKKAEAKVNLGGLYTAEQAFFSEYGGYGNNLRAMGFQTDGANMMYVIGFTTGGCNGLPVGKAQPTKAGTIGTVVKATFPQYYTYTVGGNKALHSTRAGNLIMKNCPATVAQANAGAYNAGNPKNTVLDVQSIAPGDANAFLAVASGVIAPGVSKTTPNIAKGEADIWTIDEERLLSNTVDGVR